MIDKLKWLGAAIFAGVMAVLAFLYGKETLAVLQSKIKANAAKGKVLELDLKAAEAKAAAETSEEKKRHHIAKAETLRTSRELLAKQHDALTGKPIDLKVSDVDLARARNRSRGAA